MALFEEDWERDDFEPSYESRGKKKRERQEEDDRLLEQTAAAKRLGRTKQAMQMRVEGMDYSEIAYQLGYGTAEAAAKDVHEALEEEFLNNESTSSEILRMIEIKRLNTIYNALLPGITRGNSRSADVAIKASDRIAKLAGLDAPVKTEVIEMHVINGEIERMQRLVAETKAQLALEGKVIEVEVED